MEKREQFIYAVKVGRIPGIYHTKEDMLKQVVNFPGAIVGKFTDIDRANKYMESDVKPYRKALSKEEKERLRKQKMQRNKRLKLKLKGDTLCFIDCEADRNVAISLGAVIINNTTNEILSTFYSTIRPKNFEKLDDFTKKLTGLTDEEINNSLSFPEVYEEFSAYLKKYNVTDIFSWGKNDKKFLQKCNGKGTGIINSIKSIQTIISMATSDIIYNTQWSLKNIKTFFDIPSEVSHNALYDAIDLCNVYIKWKDKQLNISKVLAYKSDADISKREKVS